MSTVVEQSPLPTRHAIRTLLEGLVGRDVEVKDSDVLATKSTNLVAVYVTDKLTVAALALLDLEGAARLGGALAMLPKGGIDDAITARVLDDLLRDNAYEVLNVLAAVFNVENAPHVRLYKLYGPNGSVPADILSLSQAIGQRLDITLAVTGYGPGRLSVVIR